MLLLIASSLTLALLVAAFVTVRAFRTAKDGYEDSTGFHEGALSDAVKSGVDGENTLEHVNERFRVCKARVIPAMPAPLSLRGR